MRRAAPGTFSFAVEPLYLPAETREVALDVVHHRWRRYHLAVRVSAGLLVYSRCSIFDFPQYALEMYIELSK